MTAPVPGEPGSNLTPVTPRSRLVRAVATAGRQQPNGELDMWNDSPDPLGYLRGLDNPYGVGASAYEPHTVLFDDYERAYGKVQADRAAAQAADDAKFTVDFGAMSSGPVAAQGRVGSVISAAMELANRRVPYVWGGTSARGVDCSGLLYYAITSAGIPWKRYRAVDYGRMGTAVSLEQARPGDVVYFDNPGDVDHVGLYIGNGLMVQAPTTGDVVRVTPVGKPTSIRRLFADDAFSNLSTPTGVAQIGYDGRPWVTPTPATGVTPQGTPGAWRPTPAVVTRTRLIRPI